MTRRDRDERGLVLPLVAIMLVALLGMVALAIDIGQIAVTRRQLQNAVDAAALAGVQVLPDDTTDATNAAQDYVQKNGVALSEIVSINITKTNVDNDTISVTARRKVNYSFARVLSLDFTNVTLSATAVVGSVTGGVGLMPFGIEDSNGPSNPGFGYTFGQQYVIKEVPGNFFAPGNYGFLALDGNGADNLRDTITQGGSTKRYHIGDTVDPKPGQNKGPADQGLTAWAEDLNHDSMNSQCNDWDWAHTYKNGKLAIKTQCQYRVILIPVIDEWPNGNHSMTILGFAQLYLVGWDQDDGRRLDAIFLDDSWSHPKADWGALNDWGTRIVRMMQ